MTGQASEEEEEEEESDSDFICTIWHRGHPHSGVNFNISGNGVIIQSYHLLWIFCICG